MTTLWVFLVVLACLWTVTEQQRRLKIKNSKCKFPFTYNGKQYDSCTKEGGDVLWCAHDSEFRKGAYSDCLPEGCKFPFEYQGKTYHGCTNVDSKNPRDYWCSEDAKYNNKYKPCPGYQEEFEDIPRDREEIRKEEVKEVFVCRDRNKNDRKLSEQWTEKCITYVCTREGVKAVDIKCEGRRGACFEVGKKDYPCAIQGINLDSCSCQVRNNRVFNAALLEDVGTAFDPNVELTKKQKEEEPKVEPEVFCTQANGQRSRVGDRINVGCETRQCGDNGQFRLVAAKCQGADGACYESGSSGYRCKENGQTYGVCTCSGRQPNVANLVDTNSLIVEDKGCMSHDGRKVNAGDRWNHGCNSYVCERGSQVVLVAAKCQDRDGNCQDLGAGPYKCLMNGRKYDDCVCKGDPKNPVSEGQIPEDAKNVRKTVVKVCYDPQGNPAAAWTDSCNEYVCDNGEPKVKKQRCRDDDEKCFDLNTKGFTCNMSGKRYNGCVCELSNKEPSLSISMGG